jgi:NAD(P)-dependent dehydrogenase (short-subunit alcohol dehydrogenase family)|tara:strand:+ start:712 stop:1146 length:435 start_codon:yes stop_codon:yes gene_type:complete
MKFFITGTRRGLGKALADKYGNCNSLEDCDVFINCKHDGFSQVDLLYKASDLNKRIINIGSNSPDQDKSIPWPYAIQKAALDKANEQLFYQGTNTTIVRFGYFDSPRVAHIEANKMSIDYCLSVIQWVLNQPHKIKDITITPYK